MADITRLEQFLNHIAHPEDPVPTPQTRLEHKFKEIAENKGGGGGGGDIMVIKVTLDQSTGTPTADKTYSEAFAAISDGTPVVIAAEGLFLTFAELVGSGENISLKFANVRVVAALNMLTVIELTLKNDNSVEIPGPHSYSLTPMT